MEKNQSSSEELKKIEDIIDKSVRPFLQNHGGDLQIVSFEGNILKVKYQGACGSCPAATVGTLMAIENVLKEEYKPDIQVQPVY